MGDFDTPPYLVLGFQHWVFSYILFFRLDWNRYKEPSRDYKFIEQIIEIHVFRPKEHSIQPTLTNGELAQNCQEYSSHSWNDHSFGRSVRNIVFYHN